MEINRKNKLLIGLGIAVAVLLGKLFHIQIFTDRYKRSAENNSMVYNYIYPPRGVIYDRNGDILVGNKTCYDILVSPRDVGQFDTLTLASILEIEPDYIREKMAYYRKYRSKIGFQRQVFLKQISSETYTRFAEAEFMFPGFQGQMRCIREYPFNAGGNLLGYISEVNSSEIKNDPVYKSGDYIGKTGLEAVREKELRGEKGYRIFLRDSRNRLQNAYQDGEFDKDAVPGSNITTTIDAHLQQYGQTLMEGKKGSVIALEPSTGEILAMVSSPGINVDVLSDIGSHYKEIVGNKYKPMFNRTVQGFYPPGSVFKLVNGLIGLQEGTLRPEMQFPCSKGFPYGNGKKLGCHAHSSPLALKDAIATSCNGYFCYVMRDILDNPAYQKTKQGAPKEAFDKWREYVSSFGFGDKLGSDFPAEAGGKIPTSAYYDRIYRKSWKFSTILSISIGQGEVTVTPLQIANLAATVANRGYYYIPHIVKDSEDVKIEEKYHEKNYTMVEPKYFDIAVEGMYMAVNGGGSAGGTAFGAMIPGIDVCGKTGTAQNPHGKDNSVFICFAPKDNPKIAMAVYVENAGFGATWAVPIASLMVEKYLTGKIRDERKDVEKRIISTHLITE